MSEYRELPFTESDYRPINGMAVLGILVSLVSVTAWLQITMTILCVCGLVISLIAMVQIRRSRRDFVGIQLVWIAVFLSLVFGCSAVIHFALQKEQRWTKARDHADVWLALVQAGEKEQVHHLTLPNAYRQKPGIQLKDYYSVKNRDVLDESLPGSRQPRSEFASYWSVLEPQQTIVKDGKRGKLMFVGRAKYEKRLNGEYFQLVYRYMPADPKLKKKTNVGKNKATIRFPLEFTIRMHRASSHQSSVATWQVHGVSIDGVEQTNTGKTIEP